MPKIIDFINKRKNFIIYSLLKVIIMVLGLITNIFIVRKLTVNDFGIFLVALMFIGLITIFGFSWSSSSILYFGSREKAKTGSINKTFWARNIIIAVSLVFTTILFALLRHQINNYIDLDVSFLILIWLYISVAEDYLSQYFLAIKKQLMSSLLSINAKIIYLFWFTWCDYVPFHYSFLLRKAELKNLRGLKLAYWGGVLAILINATRNRFAFVIGQIFILTLLYLVLKVLSNKRTIIRKGN